MAPDVVVGDRLRDGPGPGGRGHGEFQGDGGQGPGGRDHASPGQARAVACKVIQSVTASTGHDDFAKKTLTFCFYDAVFGQWTQLFAYVGTTVCRKKTSAQKINH